MAVLFIFYYLKKHELGFEFTYSSYLAKEQVYVRIQKFMCKPAEAIGQCCIYSHLTNDTPRCYWQQINTDAGNLKRCLQSFKVQVFH